MRNDLVKDKNISVGVTILLDYLTYEFMMMNLEETMGKVHDTVGRRQTRNQEGEIAIRPEMIRAAIEIANQQNEMEKEKWYRQSYEKMNLLDVFSSGMISMQWQRVIKELVREEVDENVIKSIIRPELSEMQVHEKKKAWLEMKEKNSNLYYLKILILLHL